MNELLRTGNDYMNDEGDILPVTRSVWNEPETFVPDHYQSSYIEPVESPDRTALHVPERGVSVSLEQRMLAVSAIMEYFNQANKRNGLSKSRDYNAFNDRYGRNADVVARGMSDKADNLYERKARPAFETLAQTEQLKAAGFDDDEVELGKKALMRAIYRQHGPGSERTYRERQKVVDRVTDTHNAVTYGKKTRRRSKPIMND